MDAKEADESPNLAEELAQENVASAPNENADPSALLEAKIPKDILQRYEVHSYRNAAVILSERYTKEFNELLEALRAFSITTQMIRTAGGNESDIPKLFSKILRPQNWFEMVIRGDLLVELVWKEEVGKTKKGKPIFEFHSRKIKRPRVLDGHKIDYVKDRVAFDLEWNSKDQTFDRDLYAFNAFAQAGVIDVAVLVTRSESLDQVFKTIGPALKKNGDVEKKKSGEDRMTYEKYGASTTWMGKLIYRLNSGRNGACPVLAVGITPSCVTDWSPK